jgi:hypothetical protein
MAGLEISEDLDLSNLDQKGDNLNLNFKHSSSCFISCFFQEKILLLEKVFFKILSSESDLDFELNLATFLPKLLLKLGSTEEVIRKKVNMSSNPNLTYLKRVFFKINTF